MITYCTRSRCQTTLTKTHSSSDEARKRCLGAHIRVSLVPEGIHILSHVAVLAVWQMVRQAEVLRLEHLPTDLLVRI